MKLLQVKGASYAYPPETIFQHVDFAVEAGEILTILGPNGIGKSTLLRCIVNLLKLRSGEVLIAGKPLHMFSNRELAQLVGFIPQLTQQVYNYVVRDYVVMGRASQVGYLSRPSKKDFALAEEALAELKLSHFADRPYNQLSGGEQQRVNFARILVQQPKLIILDEPTSALDLGNQMLVLKMIRQLAEKGFGVIMTTHDPNQALRLDTQVGLADKENRTFRFGTSEELLTSEKLSTAYDTPIIVTRTVEADQKVCVPLEVK
ncbi:MAG: ABC transporter ATP-binding protein [Enterococcaceae bacterium]|jgi:iron complex transport system ATP-binding protein|nr:ABC transporter ATP-binding protein [Enterococcaceae bacterium]MCI1918674.1 ABC transporter ATP-binding protein [Enterococcaceae bacterium]